MSESRRRSAAKQARRDARRRKSDRRQEAPEEASLIDEVRAALAAPVDLLGLVSTLIAAADPLAAFRPSAEKPLNLGEIVTAFIGSPTLETTALLAALGEMLSDEDPLREQCRDAVGARRQELPPWLADLRETTVHRAARMTHVLGDGEDILLGAGLPGGHELTCVVSIDHLGLDGVRDAFFVANPIDAVLTIGEANNTDPDTSFADIGLGHAKAVVAAGLRAAEFVYEPTDTWPACRAMVRWLCRLLPDGGTDHEVAQTSWVAATQAVEQFFASPAGKRFDVYDGRALLEECMETGSGDPLRWSAPRLRCVLGETTVDDMVDKDVHLALPDMLRAYVPFAHAQSGIRQELTDEALAAIAEMEQDYRSKVIEHAARYGDDT